MEIEVDCETLRRARCGGSLPFTPWKETSVSVVMKEAYAD